MAHIKKSSQQKYDWTKDPAFIAELERRTLEFETGKVKGIPWEECRTRILNSAMRKEKGIKIR